MKFLKRTLRGTRFLGRRQMASALLYRSPSSDEICVWFDFAHQHWELSFSRGGGGEMRLIAAGLSTLALCFTGMAVARTDDPAAAIPNSSEQGRIVCAATLPGFDGTFGDRTTNPTTTPTISLSNSLSHSDQAGPPRPAAAVADERTEPRTVRAVVAGLRDRYGFTIVGLDHLGTEARDCPPYGAPLTAVLQRLLRNYGYIAELTHGADQNDGAALQRLIIVGSSVLRTGDSSVAVPALPMPAFARSPGATRTAGASSVTRTLVHLASATSGLAVLTRSAQANLADLVVSLQSGCGKGREC